MSTKSADAAGKAVAPPSAEQSAFASASETFTVSRIEYENLLRASEELATLKALLYFQGVENQSVSPGDESGSEDLATSDDALSIASFSAVSTQLDRHTYGKFKPGLPSTLPVAGEKVQAPTDQAKATNATVAVVAKHTITIKTPVPVTHAEIVAVVRGGALSRVFVKRQENQVDVSFVRAADASAFLQWTRTFPLIVAGKRAKVQWAPYSWESPAYIRGQVELGKLTRNLVIHGAPPNLTEAVIRRDLRHIHNLAVISVKVEKDTIYISTNCVGGALFAKTCLISRTLYRGLWIGFYPDECAEPLPLFPSPQHVAAARITAAAKAKGPRYNPFALLTNAEMAPGEMGDHDQEESEVSESE